MSTPADDALAEALRRLRLEYLAESGQKVAQLWAIFERVEACEPGALSELRQALHKLAGSGGSYGFPEVSSRSREGELTAERFTASAVALGPPQLDELRELLRGVSEAFERASTDQGEPPAA